MLMSMIIWRYLPIIFAAGMKPTHPRRPCSEILIVSVCLYPNHDHILEYLGQPGGSLESKSSGF